VRSQVIRDWLKFPELRWLDRNAPMVAVIYGVALFGLGEFLRWKMPALRTDGWMLLVWAFFVSTVVLYHATYCVNSLAHLFGSRVWPTADDSRNNLLVAILTLGEGWHNNHHYYPTSARQGFFWWEIDLTYYLLFCLEQLGIVWDLRQVPAEVLNRRSSLKSAARLQARE
jgi:stearoyl-CoA desaturase (delta-9 desaturase)